MSNKIQILNEDYLILGLKNKDKGVFEYLFNNYYSGLCAYSLNYIEDKAIVEDIVQDFFVSLWTRKDQPDITSSLKSYLFISIKNRCLNYLKHCRVQNKFTRYAISRSEPGETSGQLFIESELREFFLSALEKLPPRCREIFELSRLKGLKNQEIADLLSISKRTVETQIGLALKIMRKELREFLPFWIIFLLLR